jgi:L-threonylcarbamoyladenylate synthase
MVKIKKFNNDTISQAVNELINGNLISFPTETVYGLGADATNDKAVAKIFSNKERPSFNPLIVHVESLDQAKKIALFNEKIEKIIDKFWPGPLTIVLDRAKKSNISLLVSSGLKTIALRQPKNEIALNLIKKLNKPIAAPSANKFGLLSPTSSLHVKKQFKKNNDISFIIDGGKTDIGIESTVIGLDKNQKLIIYRHGGVTKEEIEEIIKEEIEEIIEDNDISKGNISPGLIKKHYSPKVPLRMNVLKPKENEVFIGFGPDYGEPNLSLSGDLNEAAANLFFLLEKYENKGKGICISPIPVDGIGAAINDRLRRASY